MTILIGYMYGVCHLKEKQTRRNYTKHKQKRNMVVTDRYNGERSKNYICVQSKTIKQTN